MNSTHLYIAVNEKGSSEDIVNTIIQYDPKTKESKKIASSIYDASAINGLMANDDWIIYTDSTVQGGDPKLFAINLKSHKKILLSNGMESGFLYGNYVVWEHQDAPEKGSSPPKVMLFNLKTKSRQEIGRMKAFGLENIDVAMDGGKVVWVDTRDKKGEYHLYDIKTKKHEQFASPYPYPGYPIITRNKILTLDSTDPSSSDVKHIGSFDIDTKKYEKIPTGKKIRHVDAFKDYIVYVDDDEDRDFHVLKLTNGGWKKTDLGKKEKIDCPSFSSQGELLTVRQLDDKVKISIYPLK